MSDDNTQVADEVEEKLNADAADITPEQAEALVVSQALEALYGVKEGALSKAFLSVSLTNDGKLLCDGIGINNLSPLQRINEVRRRAIKLVMTLDDLMSGFLANKEAHLLSHEDLQTILSKSITQMASDAAKAKEAMGDDKEEAEAAE